MLASAYDLRNFRPEKDCRYHLHEYLYFANGEPQASGYTFCWEKGIESSLKCLTLHSALEELLPFYFHFLKYNIGNSTKDFNVRTQVLVLSWNVFPSTLLEIPEKLCLYWPRNHLSFCTVPSCPEGYFTSPTHTHTHTHTHSGIICQ